MQAITTIVLSGLVITALYSLVLLFDIMRFRDKQKGLPKTGKVTKEVEKLLELESFEMETYHKN